MNGRCPRRDRPQLTAAAVAVVTVAAFAVAAFTVAEWGEDRAIGSPHQSGAGGVARQRAGGRFERGLTGVEIEGGEPVSTVDRLPQLARQRVGCGRDGDLEERSDLTLEIGIPQELSEIDRRARVRIPTDRLQQPPGSTRDQRPAQCIVNRDAAVGESFDHDSGE